ncbi:transposase [Xanthobacter sp. DSM 24535]
MAFEMVKAMQADRLEWAEGYRPLGRQAFEEIIEQQMATAVEVYLEQLEGDDVAHRRNRYYRRHLLTELGDIELNVPRTRRYSPGRGAAHVRPAHGRDRPGDPRRLCARLVHPQGGRGTAYPARAAGERRNGEPSQILFARCTRCDAGADAVEYLRSVLQQMRHRLLRKRDIQLKRFSGIGALGDLSQVSCLILQPVCG